MKSKQRVSYLGKAAMLAALVALFLLIWSAWANAQSGGNYDLTWNTLGGGGGSNASGSYTLNGTLGQPGAGVLNSGKYSLVGGFWWSEQVPAGCTVDSIQGCWLTIADTQGLTTTVQIPAGAVTSTTWITITPILSPTEPISPGLRFAGHAFDLDAYRDGRLLTNFTFETTVTVTIRYSDADVKGLDEKTLKLYRWMPVIGWREVGTTRPGETLTLDMINNVLTARLRGFTRFSEQGVIQYDIYLPTILRNG